MSQLEPATFDSSGSKRVYKYVEQHGPTPLEEVQAAVGLDENEFEDHVGDLEERGYLESDDGVLGLALDLGESRSFETKDFEYTIRPAREADFEGLVDVLSGIAEKKTYVIAEKLVAELEYDETVFRHDSVRARVFFVATADGEIIGWSHLDVPLTEKLRPTAQLTVGVSDDYRGYSVGTELLDRTLDWAKANDYLKVYQHLAQTNMQAISFLESRGWEREGIREDHYAIGHKHIDQVLMGYTF